jgi:penicillin-binding protein 2
MHDPKIAIAVIVENGGYGATWAGPMAYLMEEKYLTDSIRAESKVEADRIAAANLMPSYLPRVQYIEDSIRARFYFKLTKDSSYIQKYLKKEPASVKPAIRKKDTLPQQRVTILKKEEMVEPDKIMGVKRKSGVWS